MTKFEVVGFGALNMDKLFRVNRIAGAEEESFINARSQTCGGSAANTIVGLARLGVKVGFVGKVGGDREGECLLDEFRREGVDIEGIANVENGHSGQVMGFVDGRGDRALYIDSGVNDEIKLAEINVNYAFEAEFLHLTSFVGRESFQTQKKLLEMLPENVKVSFDPGALYARKGLTQLEKILKRTYVLMPNARELNLITGESDYCRGADILIGEGVKIVAVKLGPEGCFVTNEHERHLIRAFKVKVVDTTGAGDAFCAGFLHGLLKNRNLYDCGKLGNFVASRCVMKMGARAGLPYLKELVLVD